MSTNPPSPALAAASSTNPPASGAASPSNHSASTSAATLIRPPVGRDAPPGAASPSNHSASTSAAMLVCPPAGRHSPPPPNLAAISAAVVAETEAQEENAISESVDISGGATETQDDLFAETNANTTPASGNKDDNTRKEVQAVYTQENPMRHHDDLIMRMVGELELLSRD